MCVVCLWVGVGVGSNPIIVLLFGAESYITRQISTVSQVLLTFIVV